MRASGWAALFGGKSSLLEVIRCETGALGDACQYARVDFFAVVKREDVVLPPWTRRCRV